MASEEQSDGIEYVFARTFEEANEYPLSDSLPFLVFLVGAYLLFVLKLGPDFMKNREPYKLKNTILIYNAIQVLLSALFVYLGSIPLLKAGLIPKKCCEEDPEIRKSMMLMTYVYFLGKITELLDTIFFVLRKKYNQVTFLHVYHHASVVLGTWMLFKYSISQTGVYGGFINSLVHVVMYFYYFMAALGPQYQKYLTWKRHITTFQLVQFVSIFAHQVAILLISKGCQHSIVGVIYVLFSTTLFFVLFYRFYKKSYNKPANEQIKSNIPNVAINEKSLDEKNHTKDQNDNTIVDGNKTKVN